MKKALVVGINDYPDCSLKGCVNDANSVENVLKRDEDETPNFEVQKVLNVKTKGELLKLIKTCFSGDADIALFYFSGHGHIDALGGFIVTPDYRDCDWGVSMQDILTLVNKSKCKNKVVVLDCCHSGFLGKIDTSDCATSAIGDGVTLLTASKSDEPSMEIGGHGVFTSLFIEALLGGGADVTGNITLSGIYAYIDKTLGAWEQRPVFKTNVTQFSPLRKVIPQVSPEILRKITTYFSSKESKLELDPSFEFTNAPQVEHNIIEPYANTKNIKIFSDLQKLQGVGLVIPCEEDHMYFVAMKSKSCKLTSAGQHYWNLVHKNYI